jgi:ubiquinone/menaquinone biosynthesis C-methylase UbiE
LTCRQCGQEFQIVESVPWLFKHPAAGTKSVLSETVTLYSHIWSEITPPASQDPVHIDGVEEAFGEPVVQGAMGLDAGSGCGSDTLAMASRYPSVEVISLDMSEGVYATMRATKGLPNVHVVRGSVLELPLKSDICDFAYSFGVLHHTTDPEQGMREIARVLKASGRVSVYLYEDHAGNPWKSIPLKVVTALRTMTLKLNTKVLSGLCYLLSPFVVLLFSIPARIMRQFEQTRKLADQMAFNFGTSLFSVHGDLLDRFGAPIEIRYSRDGVVRLFQVGGFPEIRITKLRTAAGWVAIGFKPIA